MWTACSKTFPSGERIEIFKGGAQLSFSEFFTLLEKSEDFAHWYSELVASREFDAFVWELPPLTTETIGRGAEFVVKDSVALSQRRSDLTPFQSHFSAKPSSDVIEFPNLGGDAILIVPTPIGSVDSYPHLAAFLRTAQRSQVISLWQVAARALLKNLGPAPRWLSTAGLGVSWLHLRLDTRPKYYSYSPYKEVT